MPAYWSHFVGHVSTQRARWTRASPNNSTKEQINSNSVDEPSSPVTSNNSDSANLLTRENESLRREIAELNAQVGQLRHVLGSRAEQIQVLIAGIRHLRVQRRRWSSLSSVDGFPEPQDNEELPSRLVNLDDVHSNSSGDEDNESEFSASFDAWLESDEEEKDEEPSLRMIMSSPPLKTEMSESVSQQISLAKSQTL